MNKKYQVFISSTYKDLVQERKILIQTTLKKGYFPASMEWFPAVDEEQLKYIKRIIDDTDYYVLVLGGLYGSIASDGKSYTEKEYDYAVSSHKKVIALVQKNPKQIERDPERIIKYEKFYKKVTSGRIVDMWGKPEELSGALAISLDKAINQYPSQGWVRCEPSKCPERLPLEDIHKKIAELPIITIRTIHIMSSGSSSYVSIIRKMLKKNNGKSNINIYIYFRLGSDNLRISSLQNRHNTYWNSLKKDHPNIKYHFICVHDFDISFRGIVLNKEIGFIGFYNRSNNNTLGATDDIICTDKNTDSGEYLIRCFLICFENKKAYSTLKECVESNIK